MNIDRQPLSQTAPYVVPSIIAASLICIAVLLLIFRHKTNLHNKKHRVDSSKILYATAVFLVVSAFLTAIFLPNVFKDQQQQRARNDCAKSAGFSSEQALTTYKNDSRNTMTLGGPLSLYNRCLNEYNLE